MTSYNLTDRQKELLRKLVRYGREERLREPIVPVRTDELNMPPSKSFQATCYRCDF